MSLALALAFAFALGLLIAFDSPTSTIKYNLYTNNWGGINPPYNVLLLIPIYPGIAICHMLDLEAGDKRASSAQVSARNTDKYFVPYTRLNPGLSQLLE